MENRIKPEPSKNSVATPVVRAPLSVPLNLVEGVINYMATKPYREVFQLIAELSKCQPAKKEEVKTDAPT